MTDDTLRMLRASAADFAKLDAARVRRLRNTELGFDRGVWTRVQFGKPIGSFQALQHRAVD